MQTSIDIPVPAIFDFKTNLDFLNRNPNDFTHEIVNDSLIKFVEVGSIRTLIKITSLNEKHLRITFLAGTTPESETENKLS